MGLKKKSSYAASLGYYCPCPERTSLALFDAGFRIVPVPVGIVKIHGI